MSDIEKEISDLKKEIDDIWEAIKNETLKETLLAMITEIRREITAKAQQIAGKQQQIINVQKIFLQTATAGEKTTMAIT